MIFFFENLKKKSIFVKKILKLSILDKIFEKKNDFSKILKNFQSSQIFEKKLDFGKIFEKLRCFRKFRKISVVVKLSILVKFFSKIFVLF